VPEVLLSGHHERIRAWRLAQSAARGLAAGAGGGGAVPAEGPLP